MCFGLNTGAKRIRPNSLFLTRILLTVLASMGSAAKVNAQAIIANTDTEHSYQQIIYKAADLAKQPFVNHEASIPDELRSMGYQQYRSIRFQGEKALWKDEANFEVQLFHPGFLYKQPVRINEIITDNVVNIPFSSDLFRYDGKGINLTSGSQSTLDFSGFRIHYPLNNENYKDELIAFQGASYFRPLGPSLQYGVSARGLAIDTAEPSGEEFPYFKEFWLTKPTPMANNMVIYALLDSASVTGAYRFELLPGIPTKIKIRADLFPRRAIKKLGIAPLTSMFFYGENKVSHIDDFRPEVHDSDGLLVATNNNEWIWRPLSNPLQLHASSFLVTNPAGFGLLQRDKDFTNYQDMEALYHRRPSVWIEPQGKPWGKGRVELVEIPTYNETNDNIVAYWIPEKVALPGQQQSFEYMLSIIDQPATTIMGKVVQTRIGWGGVTGEDNPPPKRQRLFIVDFADWPENLVPKQVNVSAKLDFNNAQIMDLQTVLLPDGKTWRASFKLLPENNSPVDMRLYLSSHNQRLTETWSYVWYPESLNE
jgi:glucans biosynthesis protein